VFVAVSLSYKRQIYVGKAYEPTLVWSNFKM